MRSSRVEKVARSLLAATLILALASRNLRGDDPVDVFSDVISVRLVNIEGVVTDASGKRVAGLTRDDFRLVVDGREVPIEYFSEVRESRIVPEGASAAELASSVPGGMESGQVRHTNYLVFIDDVFSIGAQRDQVLAGLARQLEAIDPEDRVAVMAFDGKEVARLSPWTSSPEEVRKALERARKRRSQGAFRRSERRFFNQSPSQVESYVALLEQQIETLAVGTSIAMRAAAPATGRKVLLLLSGGWPYELNSLGDRSVTGSLAARDQFGRGLWTLGRGLRIYRSLADTANLLGYTIYPIDVPGVAQAASVTQEGPAPQVAALGGDSALEATLLYLARETGGKAMLNSNRLRALKRAADDISSYYWLGFTTTRRADNIRHSVRLEARRPELEVRARRDFVDFSRQTEVEMMVEGALLFDERTSEIDFEILVGESVRTARRKMEVPIQLLIPTGDVTHLYLGDNYLANMSITVAVKDKRNTLSSVETVPFQTRSPNRPLPDATTTYEMDLQLWRERHELVVMVQDLVTGNVLTGSVEIRP